MAAKATEATPKKSAPPKKGTTNKGIKKAKRVVTAGQVHIYASFNNTHVTFTDLQGNKLSSATAGEMGFKGSRKSTPYAAQMAAQKAGQKAVKDYGLKVVDAFVRGPGAGKESALRAVGIIIHINSISDITGIPHNGCRAEKERRV